MSGLIILFAAFIVLLLIDAPVAVALGLASVLYLVFTDAAPLVIVAQRTIAGVDSFTLLAIPLFLLAGLLMLHGGITPRIVRLASAIVGRTTGGFALVAVMAAMLFGALSGSGVADVIAIGTMMLPAMKARGYEPGFSCALLGCSGALASVIPPSIVFIVYGTVTNTSIGSLFVAGIVPGVVTGLGFMLVAYIISRQNNWVGGEPFCWREFWAALRSSWLALVAPVVIVGGIRFGYFTPTEAGGIAVAYAFIVGMYVYRELTWKSLFAQLKETTETTGSILFIIATASVFGWILAAEQAPQMVLALFDNFTDSPTLVLLLLMAMFLILGTFMDVLAIIFITAPVFMPILARYNIDPVYFGVLMTMNLAIAANTPPLAIDLMAACRVARIPMSGSFRYLGAFLGVMVAVMLLILFFPNIFLFMR